MWKLGLQIGSKLDVKDTVEKWCEAEVIAVDREAGKVFISYTYWSPKVRWCCVASMRTVPLLFLFLKKVQVQLHFMTRERHARVSLTKDRLAGCVVRFTLVPGI